MYAFSKSWEHTLTGINYCYREIQNEKILTADFDVCRAGLERLGCGQLRSGLPQEDARYIFGRGAETRSFQGSAGHRVSLHRKRERGRARRGPVEDGDGSRQSTA